MLSWLPILLLIGVAAEHFALVRCCGLHPWLGGGFGMFSTVDERRLRAWALAPAGPQPIELPEALDDAVDRAEALPSESRLRDIASALVASAPPGVAAVRVEVWETRFGPAFEPLPRRLRAVELGVPTGGR